MIILKIFIWWIISELISWGIWWYAIKKIYIDKNRWTFGFEMSYEISLYPSTQNKKIEMVRLIIWPYGIIQRTIAVHKIYKKVKSELN